MLQLGGQGLLVLTRVNPIDARKIHAEPRPATNLACHLHVAAVLPGDPVDRRQAESGALPLLLRREERLENVPEHVGFDATAGITDGEPHVAARLHIGMTGDSGIDIDLVQIPPEDRPHLKATRQQVRQPQPQHARQQPAQVEPRKPVDDQAGIFLHPRSGPIHLIEGHDLRHDDLPATERQQLPRQR